MKTSTTWKNYSRFAESRGLLVLQIIQKYTDVKGKTVLDVGCGKGGTAQIFSKHGANVIAIDIQDYFNYKSKSICFKIMSTDDLQFSDNTFDIIILQDVLEHLLNIHRVLSEIKRVLKRDGLIFISTPNRLSPLNFIGDPHWNLPVISVFPRTGVKFLVKHVFKKDKRQRNDWAALFSLFKLKRLLTTHKLNFKFTNLEVAQFMFKNPTSVVCRSIHLKIIYCLKQIKAENLIYLIMNNKWGVFNYLINPTWYIVGWKIQ